VPDFHRVPLRRRGVARILPEKCQRPGEDRGAPVRASPSGSELTVLWLMDAAALVCVVLDTLRQRRLHPAWSGAQRSCLPAPP